jgi:AcrR family transcriptional regulator
LQKQQRSEETHARILEVASECFATRGYEATGVAEICEAAGISKGAFYHHFAAKHDVFLELMRRWLDTLDTLFEEMRSQTGSVPDALISMAQVIRHLSQTDRKQLLIFLEFWNQAARDPQIAQAALAPMRRYQDYFAGMIDAGIAEGSFQPVDSRTIAQIIVALGLGLIVQSLVHPDAADWEAVSREAIVRTLAGLTTLDASPELAQVSVDK